jgi:hypothetical protein
VAVAVVVALAATGFAVISLRSGGDTAQAQALTLSLTRGQSYSFHMTMAMSGTVAVGSQKQPIDLTTTGDLSWRVLSVDPAGVATVKMTLSNMTAGSGGKSASAGMDRSFNVRMTRDGRILSGGGVGNLAGGSTAGVPGMDQFTPLLPDHPVKPGDTWTKDFDQANPFGKGSFHYQSRDTLLRYEQVGGKQAAVIQSAIDLPLDISFDLAKLAALAGDAGAGLPARGRIVYGGDVSITQTAWLSTAQKSLLRATLAARFDMSMRFEGGSVGAPMPSGELAFAGTMTMDLTAR